MTNLPLGIILGIIFGIVATLPMLRMTFSDKRAALLGAFINRFAVGFLIPNALPGVHPIFRGLLLGVLLSLPDAIITKSYVPIMGLGIVGGFIIGIVTQLVGSS